MDKTPKQQDVPDILMKMFSNSKLNISKIVDKDKTEYVWNMNKQAYEMKVKK